MAANIPDLGAINHLGSQFHTNVFHTAEKKLDHISKKAEAAHHVQQRHEAVNRERFAQSAESTIKAGRTAFAKQQVQKQAAAKKAAAAHAAGVKSGRVAPAPGAPPRTFAMGAGPQGKAQAQQAKVMKQQVNNAHGQAIAENNQRSKIAASASSGQAKTMQQQRNFAHGEALKFQAAQFKTVQSQRNFAHGEAIRESKQRGKVAPAVSSPATPTPKAPSLSPSFSSTPERHEPVRPVAIPATTFSHQFTAQSPVSGPQGSPTASFSHGGSPSTPSAPASRSGSVSSPQFSEQKPKPVPQMQAPGLKRADVSPRDNSPHPTHVHPAGSSNAVLPNLTAAQPKPNQFTAGSRNARPNGLAARGSQLEAWAIGRQQQMRKQRGSDNTQLRLGD